MGSSPMDDDQRLSTLQIPVNPQKPRPIWNGFQGFPYQAVGFPTAGSTKPKVRNRPGGTPKKREKPWKKKINDARVSPGFLSLGSLRSWGIDSFISFPSSISSS
ncbi:hypothetical protein N7505_004803 [Penicillium chrysogenum]|uniref:Uncharacterized protein n=1 Tax=Penicillium chrysogenum TaxID=5076 RepID=A0ABQ8WG48_PENCH|nr:hypothetical protein N7505_004803 [Penicillium chrysogenum]